MKQGLVFLAVSGALGVVGVALAAGWSDFGPAFPGLPCNDGWAACLVEGQVVSPDMVVDSAGRPQVSNQRVGFFDLQPLPAFSPFSTLSPYAGSADAALADAAPPAEAPAEAEPAEAEPAEAEPEDRAEREEGSRREPPVAARADREEREDRAPTAVATTRTPPPETTAARTPPPATAPPPTTVSAPPSNTQTAARTTPPPTTAPPPTTVVATQPPPVTKTQSAAATAPPPTTATQAASAPVAVAAASRPPPPANAAPQDDSCDDLVALEAPAMMGQLGVGRRKCLEGVLGAGGAQTQRNKVSRVLIFDAEARGDRSDWERLMKRHLEDIDRSDPNLCMKYAIHLSRGGVARANGVIRWADYALENKQQWSGPSYTKNVYSLYKLRAQGAHKLWESAEAKFVAERNDENEAAAAKYRGVAKDYAREWLDYARASSSDIKDPLALCVSASGNKEFCDG